MKKYNLYASVITLAIIHPAAFAAENVTPNESTSLMYAPHIYLGGRIGGSLFQNACGNHVNDCNNITLGYGLYGGYQWTDWAAFELGVNHYGKPDARYSDGSVSASVKGADISVKLSHPFFSQWNAYTRLGGTLIHIDKESDWGGKKHETNWKPLIAVGLTYQLAPKWSLRGEYQLIDGIGNTETRYANLHTLSLGLTYHFGQGNSSLTTKTQSIPPVVKENVIPAHIGSFDFSVPFAFDSYRLKTNDRLVKQATSLSEYSHGNIAVFGYTDSVGSSTYNQSLSKRRAQSVATYLENKGVERHRIRIMGLGESAPIASNKNKQGRAANRRVNVTVDERVSQ